MQPTLTQAAEISDVGGSQPGLLMVNVDVQKGCGNYGLVYDYVPKAVGQ